MLNYTNFYILMVVVMTPYLRICHIIEGIVGNRTLRVGEIRLSPATIALAKFSSTSSQVRSGFNGLPYRRSGLSGKRPSVVGDCAFFEFFFKCLAPIAIPLFKRTGRTDKHTHKRQKIFKHIIFNFKNILANRPP